MSKLRPHHLILSLDYEVFGDGSGCVDSCLVAPTEAIASIAEEFGAPVSLFVEALELERFSCFAMSRQDAVRRQLEALVNAGHKLELHLHPQWLGARLVDGGWSLDFSRWRCGDLDSESFERAVVTGCRYINSVGDEPAAYRAGGWTIQPSNAALAALPGHGILMDSTVAPGMYNPASGDWFDFRNVPDLPFWATSGDVCTVETDGAMLEVPISTAVIGKFRHARALAESRKGPRFPVGCEGSYAGPNNKMQTMIGRFAKLAGMGTVMLDFSTQPAWALIQIIEDHLSRFSATDAPIPIVAIGHNKNFTTESAKNLREMLAWSRDQAGVCLSDYRAWHRALLEHSPLEATNGPLGRAGQSTIG